MRVPDGVDEYRHDPTPDLLWNESYYLDWFNAEGKSGGYVRLGLYPNLGVSWFWCCLVGEGQPVVRVINHQVPLPEESGLKVRSPGLRAEMVVEKPLARFSVGVDADGIAVDNPADAYDGGSTGIHGNKVAVGVDLIWRTDGPVDPPEGADPWAFYYGLSTRYEVPCRVTGEVMVGDRHSRIDGWGQRDHSWAVRDWWTDGWIWFSGRLDDGERFHAVAAVGREGGIGYWSTPAGLMGTYKVTSRPESGPDGIPTSGKVTLGEVTFELRPVGWAPVLLVNPDDGCESRLPRGLMAVTTDDGRTGHAWVEYNQPQAG